MPNTDLDFELFGAAFHSASIGVALVGLDGRWQRVNHAVCEIVGYPEAELLALTFQQITHPEDLDTDLALVGQLLRGEIASYELEKRYFHKTGSIVWIQLSAALARDGQGAPVVFVVQIQNVTKRKLAEQARDEAERTLQQSLREKEALLAALRTTQDEALRLREGLVTICAWTKRVKWEGRWISVDEFLHDRLHLNLTHGISEEAAEQMIAEIGAKRSAPAASGGGEPLSPAVKMVVDTPAESVFDRFTGLAAQVFRVPVALISVVDESRQFFKSLVGLSEPWASRRETPLSHSFCQYVVHSGEPLIVSDAREHALVRDNPAVSELGVVSYAGVPIFDEAGRAFAALCAIDSRPRTWSPDEVSLLRSLAEQVTSEVVMRQKLARLAAAPSAPIA